MYILLCHRLGGFRKERWIVCGQSATFNQRAYIITPRRPDWKLVEFSSSSINMSYNSPYYYEIEDISKWPTDVSPFLI